MAADQFLAYVALMAVTSYAAYATDPSQLQDFCVGVNHPTALMFVNGLMCKSPLLVTADDFTFRGLNIPGRTKNNLGSNVRLVSATNLPGLNTLGISMAHIDFVPNGLNPPHTHPRATEILTVVQGTLIVGFVTSNLQNGRNKLFTQHLNQGDVFVFPQGLVHFQFNHGPIPAVAIAAFSSQNPGLITIANSVFESNPSISVDVLAKAFHVEAKVIELLQSQFQPGNDY